MNEKEFKEYVYEQRRQGRSDSQIARSLGMSLKHLIGRLNGVDVDKINPTKQEVKKKKKKQEVKPVSGAKQPEKHEKPKKEKPVDIPKAAEEEKKPEDLSWME